MPMSGLGVYDPNNIFARILRGEIPSRRVYEDEFAVAFHDIAPQAPLHVLVIPRGQYVSLADFTAGATDREIAGFWRAVGNVARQLALEAPGYRVLSNIGPDAGQEVPHFHVHLFAGRKLGRMVAEGRRLRSRLIVARKAAYSRAAVVGFGGAGNGLFSARPKRKRVRGRRG